MMISLLCKKINTIKNNPRVGKLEQLSVAMLLPSKDRLLNGLSEAKGFSLLSLALSCERKVTAYLFYCSSLFPLFSSEQINLSALPAIGENTANVWESIFYFLANFLKACGAVWWIYCLLTRKALEMLWWATENGLNYCAQLKMNILNAVSC